MGLIFVWLAIAILTTIIASSKGRSAGGWLILGCLFSIFAFAAVALMPSMKRDPLAPSPETHVRCPDCRELVYVDARKCKHCGTILTPNAALSVAPAPPSKAEMLGRRIGSKFASRK